ncbi:MAG TPA: FAD-binding protein [Clostridia bacterium]|nr:FAD-binding protein [Clostridia bacterium]
MKLQPETIITDVLVIGGGCAGSMAAIRIKEAAPELKVCIMEKGHLKRSGSITMGMDALNVVVIPGISTPFDYIRMLRKKTWGIMDFLPNYTLAQRSFEILKVLENWGVFFPKDAGGNYNLMQVDDDGKFCVGMDEPDLKPMLEKKIREAGIEVLNKTMATRLVVQEGRVLGAVGFNLTDGRLIFCQAQSIILANGSAARFGLPNTGYLYGTFDFPGNAGDGFSLAFRAGARITGMEFTLKYTLVKDLNIPLIYIVITRGGQVINAAGEIIVDENNLSVFRLREALEKDGGPFYLKTDHLPKEKIMEMESVLFSTERPMQRRYWELKDIKFGRDLIELSLTEAQLCGGHGLSGVVINEKAETNIKGLFAAGDVSSVPMQHLTGAFVYGQIAAESAVQYCTGEKSNRFNRFLEKAFNQELQRLGNLLNVAKDNKIPPASFEYKLRRIINEYLLSPKNDSYLKKGLELIDQFRYQLPHQVQARTLHEFSKILEIEFILDCAQMSAAASLARKESRWGHIHYRTDYPETDDKNWLKHIDLQIGSDTPEVKVSLREIQRGEME